MVAEAELTGCLGHQIGPSRSVGWPCGVPPSHCQREVGHVGGVQDGGQEAGQAFRSVEPVEVRAAQLHADLCVGGAALGSG